MPPMPGEPTKNLFLQDEKGMRYFLVTVGHEKKVDLKELRKLLGVSKLSFSSAEDLQKYLGVDPGAVTLLGLMNDTQHKVEAVIDKNLWSKALQCHPLVNTATLVISAEGIKKYLDVADHTPKILEVPERNGHIEEKTKVCTNKNKKLEDLYAEGERVATANNITSEEQINKIVEEYRREQD